MYIRTVITLSVTDHVVVRLNMLCFRWEWTVIRRLKNVLIGILIV